MALTRGVLYLYFSCVADTHETTLLTESDEKITYRSTLELSGTSAAAGVIARLREVVTSRPDGLAIDDGARRLTHRGLAEEAVVVLTAVRGALLASPPEPASASKEASSPDQPASSPAQPVPLANGPEPVAVLWRHEAGAVAAVIGVVASGHPLLMLDPRTPAPRLRQLVQRVGVRFCVADEANADVAAELVEHVVRVPAPGAATGVASTAETLWASPPDPRAAAVLSFTSGSTGVPKVVVIDHRQLVSDAWLNSTAGGCYGADDVIAHTLPMAFNAGLMVTLAGPLVGATMALYDVRTAGIGGMARWLDESGVTVAHASPAILRAFILSGPDPAQLRRLRALTIAGEPAYARDIEVARRVLPPHCTIYNRYGSSETGLIAQFEVRADDVLLEGPLPAGFPLPTTGVTVLDPAGQPVVRGESGTVAVTRAYVATGYWGDEATTAASFTDNPDGTRTYRTSDVGYLDDAGRLRLQGRRDHSVKIRGYLVEPGEVDAVLFTLPQVREALVVGSSSDGTTRLVAYVVPAVEQLSAAAVRAALGEILPSHMVPQTIVFLEGLPRTDRGKLDRSALPPPPELSPGSANQQFSAWERLIADLWAKVLAVEDLGLDDDFFELGGDSLAAQALMAAMVDDFGVPEEAASTSLLVHAPTIRQFANRLTRKPDSGGDTLVELQSSGTLPPLFVMAGGGGLGVAFVGMSRHLGADQPVWALQAHAMERRGIPDWSVRATARRNIAEIRRVRPNGPYHLAGHSYGGLVALEMAHQLRAAGAEVGLLIMLDSFPPDPTLHAPPPGRSLRLKMRQSVGLALTGIRGTPGLDQYWRFYRLSEVLHRLYRCDPWPGDTLLVIADSPEREARSQWDRHLTGKWRLVSVGGDHLSMLREPYVAETAEVIAEGLQRWREEHPNP